MPQHCVRDMPTAGHGGCTVVTFSSCHLRDCLLVNASTAWTEGNSPAQNAETQDDMVLTVLLSSSSRPCKGKADMCSPVCEQFPHCIFCEDYGAASGVLGLDSKGPESMPSPFDEWVGILHRREHGCCGASRNRR